MNTWKAKLEDLHLGTAKVPKQATQIRVKTGF